jgi:hypothetical protein
MILGRFWNDTTGGSLSGNLAYCFSCRRALSQTEIDDMFAAKKSLFVEFKTIGGRNCINWKSGENSTFTCNPSVSPGTGSCTVAGWFNQPSTSTQRNIALFGFSGGTYHFVFLYGTGRLSYQINADTPAAGDSTELNLDDGNWHSFVCVRDSVGSRYRVAIDGGTFNDTTITVLGNVSSTATVWFGKYTGGSALEGIDYLSDLQYYDGYAFTQTDATNFHSGTLPSTKPSARWKFDESEGPFCDDSAYFERVSNGNNHAFSNIGSNLKMYIFSLGTNQINIKDSSLIDNIPIKIEYTKA